MARGTCRLQAALIHFSDQPSGCGICDTRLVKAVVIGHVEWIRFARVDHVPESGEIAHSFEDWEQAGGGAAVAALQLARLADEVALFTALGDDELGRAARAELEERGVRVYAAEERLPTRWALTHIDDRGERTITTVGTKLRPRGNDDRLPWHELAEADAVVFVAGDEDAALRARRGRVLTATSRELDVLRRAAVVLEALVGSGEDAAERFRAGDLDPPPSLVVTTSGALGGWMQPGGPFTSPPPPGPIEDTYGAGDCFLAGLAFALASGLADADAVAFAARCGAAALTGRGVAPKAVSLQE
jgi:ribokinase